MKLNNLIFTALAGFSIILAGCQNNDENEQHYDNKLFISASNFTKEILFKAGDTNVETGLSVAIAKPEEHDIKVTMSPAPELLSTYKLAYYDETAVLLSEEHYSMPETSTTIKSGSIVSPELPIEFINTGELDIKTTYVLPVTIKSVEGIGVLQSAKTYYYVFRGASLINVVCNISRNRAYPDFKNDSKFNNLTENTMEILFKANSFPNTLNTLMGIESNYLLRIGDATIPNNQLQVATSVNNCTSADLQLESGKWYHVAVAFNKGNVKVYINGVEKLSGSTGKSSV
ncbi:BT_3987 domain-containing protein, partial [Bacteroides xylanisolvens]